jgi:hypothetical protein
VSTLLTAAVALLLIVGLAALAEIAWLACHGFWPRWGR